MDHRGDAGGSQHAGEQAAEGVGIERRDRVHDLGHRAQRLQAAGQQVQAVEDQRQAHRRQRDVAGLRRLREYVDQREDAGQDQAERTERQRDQPVAERGADVRAHDHADRRPQRDHAGIDQAHDHDGHRRARLQDTGDRRSREQTLDRRAGDAPEHRAHPVDGEILDPVGHEFEAQHEDAEPADDGNQNFPE